MSCLDNIFPVGRNSDRIGLATALLVWIQFLDILVHFH
jgi:hypothetical protein